MKNIVLIGMMGAAKTTTGKCIAERLNRPFFDSDLVYTAMYRESISDTFAKHGEEEFRRRETEVCKKLGGLDGAVIACGGGVVMREENMTALAQNAVIFQLTASPEAIYERVSRNDNRPLLKNGGIEKVKEIMQARKPLYDKYAHYTVDNSFMPPKRSAEVIIGLYNKTKV